MKYIGYILALIPVSFLFHLYEYFHHLNGQEAPHLIEGYILLMLLTSFFIKKVTLVHFLILNLISVFVSLILASHYIPNDGDWFTPLDRNGAVLFIAVVFLFGLLIIETLKWLFSQSRNRD